MKEKYSSLWVTYAPCNCGLYNNFYKCDMFDKCNNKHTGCESEQAFKNWKLNWFKKNIICTDFVCCHELTSCGVDYLCGDCTIYETWLINKNKYHECDDISCEDCMNKYNCNELKVK